METVKKFLFAIILLGVVAVAWVGLNFYLESQKKSVSSSVEQYIQPIKSEFPKEDLDAVFDRSQKSLPIQPKEFTSLINKD